MYAKNGENTFYFRPYVCVRPTPLYRGAPRSSLDATLPTSFGGRMVGFLRERIPKECFPERPWNTQSRAQLQTSGSSGTYTSRFLFWSQSVFEFWGGEGKGKETK